MSLLLARQVSPTGSGASSIVFADAGNALLTFSGSGASVVVFADSGAALLVFRGSGASTITFVDSGSGSVAAADISGSGASVIVFDDSGLGPRAFILDGGGPPPPKDHIPKKPRKYARKSEPFQLAPDLPPLQEFVFGHGQTTIVVVDEGRAVVAWGDGQDDDDLMTLLALLEEL